MAEAKKEKVEFTAKTRRNLIFLLWFGALLPAIGLVILFLSPSEDELPSLEMLENPPELLASKVIADDGKTELGRYWSVNRTTVDYKDVSSHIFDALISTEDERFFEHSGIDFRATARALYGMGKDGGASTISQQLAKNIFTLRQREIDAELRAQGKEIPNRGRGLVKRLFEKVRENIISVRLEDHYTKKEIATMYLNQFDFLYNAVGVENAAKVYFNKKASELDKLEAATLIGMVKNPGLYSPLKYRIRDWRSKIASQNNIDPKDVTQVQIQERVTKDSLRAINRRNTVLKQWVRNSEAENPALTNYLTQAEYDSLKDIPITLDYQVVDHKEGMAPYFRESLRAELKELFSKEDENGKLIYAKADGSKYDIYNDGLKIYTTINPRLQKYAEFAVAEHIGKEIQPAFTKNNKRTKRFPFANTFNSQRVTDKTIASIMKRARKNSDRFRNLKKENKSEKEIFKTFDIPVPMKIFSWDGDIDTILSPNDSILYYKNLIRAGMVSIEPSTGFVKAWVGGVNFKHFAYDAVRSGRRQVGSTMKPFVYSAALSMQVVKPCTKFDEETTYEVAPCYEGGKNWSVSGKPAKDVRSGLAASSNPTTVAVMSKMGACSGPATIAKILKRMDIDIPENLVTPSICLGTPDLRLYDMVAAQCIFANQGMWIRPTTILRIEDRNGNIIYDADLHAEEILNPTVAYETLQMMKGVTRGGTGSRLRYNRPYGGLTQPIAGKTGTTQSNSDGWFMGLTPDLVTGVWVGAEDKYVRFTSTGLGQGANTALPIFGYYMNKVYKDSKLKISQEDFEQPITYDSEQYSCDGDLQDIPDIGIGEF